RSKNLQLQSGQTPSNSIDSPLPAHPPPNKSALQPRVIHAIVREINVNGRCQCQKDGLSKPLPRTRRGGGIRPFVCSYSTWPLKTGARRKTRCGSTRAKLPLYRCPESGHVYPVSVPGGCERDPRRSCPAPG